MHCMQHCISYEEELQQYKVVVGNLEMEYIFIKLCVFHYDDTLHVNYGGAYRNHVDFLFRIDNKLWYKILLYNVVLVHWYKIRYFDLINHQNVFKIHTVWKRKPLWKNSFCEIKLKKEKKNHARCFEGCFLFNFEPVLRTIDNISISLFEKKS